MSFSLVGYIFYTLIVFIAFKWRYLQWVKQSIMNILQLAKVVLIFITFLFSAQVFSQDEPLLEMEQEMEDATVDTTKLRLLIQLSRDYATVDPNRGIKFGTEALIMSKKLDDIVEVFWSYANIARCYNSLNNADSAILYARIAYSLLGHLNDKNVEFLVLSLYGNAFLDIPNNDSAQYYYNLALDIAQELNDKSKMAAVYNNYGLIYSDQGRWQESYEHYIKALNNFEATNDLNNQAITLNNIGIVNQNLGDDNKAIEYLLKAAEINKGIGDNYNLSMNLSNIGVSYKMLKIYDKALEYYNKSSGIAEKYGFAYDLARNSLNMGNVYVETGDTLRAIASFEKSLKISREQGFAIGVLFNNIAIAEILIGRNSLDEARELLQEALTIIEETKLFAFKENYFDLMSYLAEKRGDNKRALMFYKKYESFKDSLLKVQNKSEIKDIQEKYETEKKTLENEQLREMNLVNTTVIRDQRILGGVVIVSMILAIAYAMTIFRSRRKLKTAYHSLQDLNHKVLDQKKQLEEANQTKDKMFSIIAHDLRGPFSSMMGFLQMITDEYKDFDDEQKVHMLQITYEQSLKTYGLLENLLQWSLSQRGMVEYHPEDFNLYMLVENQLDVFKYRASNKNLILENSVKSDLTVCLDVNMTTSILRNLLGNAVKFTPQGGKISFSSFETKKGVAIQINDTGVGMPSEVIQGFGSGARIESTKGTENESGTGLGLEIVKDFAQRMKVEIQIKSKKGIGTEFILILPSEVIEK